MKAVTKAQTLKLAIVIDEDKAHTTQILHGVELAVELVNEQGGALGKKLELVTLQGAANQQLYCERVQQVCDQYEVAALIGPLSTDTLSSARALTQFAALPHILQTKNCIFSKRRIAKNARKQHKLADYAVLSMPL